MVNATEEQKKAIAAIEWDLTVSAGAGSGKTWVLTQKYLELLNQGYVPEEIVVITFTDKAAAEMKERIRGAVAKKLLLEEEQGNLDNIIQWKKHRQGVEKSVISTIHGYCSRLLKENPLAAWVDPDFLIADEIKGNLLLEESVVQAIEEDLLDKKLMQAVVNRLSINKIISGIISLYPKILEQEVNLSILSKKTHQMLLERKKQLPTIIEQLEDAVHTLALLQSEVNPKTNSYGAIDELCARWPSLKDELYKRAESGEVDSYFVNQVIRYLVKTISRPAKAIAQVVEEISMLTRNYLDLFCANEYLEWLEGITHVLSQADIIYKDKKKQDGNLDFMDLQLRTIKMLEVHPAVLEKYHQRYKVLMVDEFQDTNLAQKKLIELLLRGGNTRLVVVGDEKQSIYRFRGADVAVFQQVEREIKGRGGEKIPLTVNFRTQKPIINFINHCFQQLLSTGYQPLVPNRRQLSQDPVIQFIYREYDSEEGINREGMLVHESQQIALRIKEMIDNRERIVAKSGAEGEFLREANYGDITILLSTMANVHLYELALLKADIPFYILGSRGFYQRQEVVDMGNALKVVADPADETALVALLRSPMIGLSDETLLFMRKLGNLGYVFYYEPKDQLALQIGSVELEKIEMARAKIYSWQKGKTFLPLTKLIEKILNDTKYLPILLSCFGGAQAYGNLQKLISLAAKFDQDHTLTLNDFVKYLSEMQEKSTTESQAQVENEFSDTVKIMTIHQSKGLEFPIVFLPDLSRDFIFDKDLFIYDQELGLGIKMYSGKDKDIWPGDGLYRDIKAGDDLCTIEEEKRKLYVAMTRARDYLVLVGSYKRTKKEKIHSLEDKNWLSWLLTILNLERIRNSQTISCSQETWHMEIINPAVDVDVNRETSRGVGDGGVNQLLISEQDKPRLLSKAISSSQNSLTAVSVTALLDYFSCPRKYYFSKIRKIPISVNVQEVVADRDNEIANRELGLLAHKVIELMPQSINTSQVAEFVNSLALASGYRNTPKELTNWIENLMNSDLIKSFNGNELDYRELPFRLQISEWGVTGVIDRLVKLGEQVYLLDYKANRVTEKTKKELVDYYTPQLKIYSLVVTQLLKWPTPINYLVFLRDIEPIQLYFTLEELEVFHEHLGALLAQLSCKQDMDFYKKTTIIEKCFTCGYLSVCGLVT